MRRVLAALAFLTALPAFGATPQVLLRQWMAGPTKPYQGRQTAIVATEAGRVTSEVIVRGDGKGQTLRQYTTGGAKGAAMLQTPSGVWSKAPDGRWSRLPRPISARGASSVSDALRSYKVTVGAPVRIAGRTTTPLVITPRQPYNPSRRVWLDTSTGVALKEETYAPGGRLRSSSAFVTFGLGSQPASAFRPPTSAGPQSSFGPGSFEAVAWKSDAEKRSGHAAPSPSYVPSGYEIETYGVMKTRRGDFMPAARYSDGLAAFTIFRRHTAQESPGRGRGGPGFRGGRGATGRRLHQMQSTVQQSIVSLDTSRGSYLLVGDLAESQLKKVAESLP